MHLFIHYTLGHEQMLQHSNDSFVFVTFVSRIFATKYSLILIMSKSCTDYMQKSLQCHKQLRSLPLQMDMSTLIIII